MKSSEARLKTNRRYKEKNKELLREKQRLSKINLRIETFNQYGTTCSKCGFDDLRALQIDHINNNGAEERKSLGGQQFSGHIFYAWLKKQNWPPGYQTLCANCNIIKHIEYRNKTNS